MNKISVVINTFNSEKFLEEVLESVKGFDEVIICDMYSQDRTVEIAKQYGCQIFSHPKTGYVEPPRDFAISKASYDWVFVVDSDEVITQELREFLYQFVSSDNGEKYSAVKIPRKNFFWGKFMRGDYPDYIVRLIRRDRTVWSDKIHSRPEITGEIFTIPKKQMEMAIIHLANEDVTSRIAKINSYTSFEVSARSTKEFSIFKATLKSSFRFFRTYILKGGFRDGKAGYVFAKLNGFYKFLTIAKLWEEQLKK